jgi:hypothetical protein
MQGSLWTVEANDWVGRVVDLDVLQHLPHVLPIGPFLDCRPFLSLFKQTNKQVSNQSFEIE